MATVTVPAQKEAPRGPRPTHCFTVQQYERLAETGVLTANDRVELLEGLIVDKVTQNPPHNAAIDLGRSVLQGLLPPGWIIREQKAVRLIDSEPEPDLAVVRGPVKRYARRHPRPTDIAQAVEVADTSLADDRNRKGRIYARARIPVYWIINLVEAKVEVYTQPRGGRVPAYRERRDYGRDDVIPLIIAGQEVGVVAVRDLLP
jgi:Uma2 family endonuclease